MVKGYLFGLGQQDRSTGELKFGQRWYNPLTGTWTWTQQDTLNAPLDPFNANRYEYAADNPINNIDPTGLSWWSAAESIWEGSSNLLFGGGPAYYAATGSAFLEGVGTVGLIGAGVTGVGFAVVGGFLLGYGIYEATQ